MNEIPQKTTSVARKKIIPAWIRRTPFWKSLSNLKLVFKRMYRTAQYWNKSDVVQVFRYFLKVEGSGMADTLLCQFRFRGITFEVRPMEWHLMEAILLDEEYGCVSHLFDETNPPAVIIDAGANVGMFSVYSFSKWPQTILHAIEPSPNTYPLLLKNKNANLFAAWYSYQYALWDENGEIKFESENLSMASHISNSGRGVSVPSIRLEHFVKLCLKENQRISILKMDIEGAEEAVLSSSRSVLSLVDAMVIEIHPQACNEKVVRDILIAEFPFVYDFKASSTQYPVVLACRKKFT